MKKITFAEKNSLIVKHQGKKHFYKDLELFKKHFPSHELNTDLANANQFSIERLDGQMLNELLSVIDIKEIIENRTEKEPEPIPEPPKVRTIEDVKKLLIEQCNLTTENIEQIGEDYLQFLTTKDDEAIIAAIQKFVAFQPVQEGDTSEDGTEKGDFENKPEVKEKAETKNLIDGGYTNAVVQLIERGNVKIFQQRIIGAKTIEAVEAILQEDKEGGERSTVQQAGQKRIEILQASQDDQDSKKKD